MRALPNGGRSPVRGDAAKKAENIGAKTKVPAPGVIPRRPPVRQYRFARWRLKTSARDETARTSGCWISRSSQLPVRLVDSLISSGSAEPTHGRRRRTGACRQGVATPIAASEYGFAIVPLRPMLEARSVDIVMLGPASVRGDRALRHQAPLASALAVTSPWSPGCGGRVRQSCRRHPLRFRIPRRSGRKAAKAPMVMPDEGSSGKSASLHVVRSPRHCPTAACAGGRRGHERFGKCRVPLPLLPPASPCRLPCAAPRA